jgi:hypothetical protein
VTAGLQAIRGMNDVLPQDMVLWRSFGAIVEAWLERWGYRVSAYQEQREAHSLGDARRPQWLPGGGVVGWRP